VRLTKSGGAQIQEGDFTPMIDMVFQLIAFFMVLINFSEADQNEAIQLPSSQLARPPDGRLEHPITLHVSRTGTVFIGGDEIPAAALPLYLRRESAALQVAQKTEASANVIIRGDQKSATGKIQEIIRICQENKFEKFLLRAKEAENP